MTDSQTEIMRHFRRYHVEAGEMLFFNTSPARVQSAQFYAAMASLVRDGLVVEERRRDAYSLTKRGYLASLSV